MTAMDQAVAFVAECRAKGFSWEVRNGIVTISKLFPANNREAFVDCDVSYGSILSLVPLKGGSVWGTDGGGVGAIAAMQHGKFVMNKSGTGVRFLNALAKVK